MENSKFSNSIWKTCIFWPIPKEYIIMIFVLFTPLGKKVRSKKGAEKYLVCILVFERKYLRFDHGYCNC